MTAELAVRVQPTVRGTERERRWRMQEGSDGGGLGGVVWFRGR